MESQQIGAFLKLVGIYGKTYMFKIYKLNHDFTKSKINKSKPTLYIITKEKVKDSWKYQNILLWDKTADLSNFVLNEQVKASLLKKGATHICVLRRKKVSDIEKIETELSKTLNQLMVK